eukprot:g8675.t1
MWNPNLYAKNASFVYKLGTPLLELLRPKPGESVLDLGCGTGELSRSILNAGCRVIGVDSSPAMVQVARENGVEAYVMDGHDLDYENEFDAVFSNAALHWMKSDLRRVIRNVKRSLKLNGRFVGEFGGKGNVKTLFKALELVLEKHGLSFKELSPFFFPSADEYSALLEAEGMRVESIVLFPRKTPVPSGPTGWLDVFAKDFFVGVDPYEKQKICEEVEIAMNPLEVDANGVYLADYVRLRFHATKIDES